METGYDVASDLAPLEQVIGVEIERPLHVQREQCFGCTKDPRLTETPGTWVRVNEVGKRDRSCSSSDVSIDPTAFRGTRASFISPIVPSTRQSDDERHGHSVTSEFRLSSLWEVSIPPSEAPHFLSTFVACRFFGAVNLVLYPCLLCR
jgi:hypothetical protein